jgi:hypothetical protein
MGHRLHHCQVAHQSDDAILSTVFANYSTMDQHNRNTSGQKGRPKKLFMSLRSAPKTQGACEWDLELVSWADFWCNLHYFSSRGRSRGSRGPPWTPRGGKSAKSRGRIYHFILPKVCPDPTGIDHRCGSLNVNRCD